MSPRGNGLRRSLYNYYFEARPERHPEGLLIGNGLTGALDRVSPEIAANLAQDSWQRLPGATLERMCIRGYLTRSSREVEKGALLVIARAVRARADRQVRFEINPGTGCNLACPYCYENEARRQGADRHALTGADGPRVARAVEELAAGREVASIVLLGGEPLLERYRAFNRSLFDLCRRNAWKVRVVTNGTTADRELERVGADPEVVESLQITLDGVAEIHDRLRPAKAGGTSFERICGVIRRLCRAGYRVVVRTNLHRKSAARYGDLLDQLVDREVSPHSNLRLYCHALFGVPQLDITRAVMPQLAGRSDAGSVLVDVEAESAFAEMFMGDAPEYRSAYCAAMSNNFVFWADGELHACAIEAGNGKDSSHVGRWRPDLRLRREKREVWRSRTLLAMEKCQECPAGLMHAGGCANRGLSYFGQDFLDPVCEDFVERVEAVGERALAVFSARTAEIVEC